jgi:hypothetical protein
VSRTLDQILGLMSAQGVTRVYAKLLARNDNSKNQVYLGGDFSSLNLLPARPPEVRSAGSSTKPGKKGQPILAAALNFAWMDDHGTLYPAPNAKLILYPQFPEVRLSGFLLGCARGPSDLMGATRVDDRILLLGIRSDGMIVGYAAGPESAITQNIADLRWKGLPTFGVLEQLPLLGEGEDGGKRLLLERLGEIHAAGWIDSKRLSVAGVVPCEARNCGGYTLEAELGILPNGYAEPDFHGWEVKQHRVPAFTRRHGGPVTLFTPEPNGGYYASNGPEAFVARYGYPDTMGRAGRRNFGGVHKVGSACARTNLKLVLDGYDAEARKLVNPGGGLLLMDAAGEVAASWAFTGLMAHWQRKHAQAAYVPSLARNEPRRQYRYGSRIRLGEGTDFLKLLEALHGGLVYYDPGIKVVTTGDRTEVHRRSQFRVKSRDLDGLYTRLEEVDVG